MALAIGKEIKYVVEEPDAFEARLLQVGVPTYVIRHLAAVFDEHHDNLLDDSNNTIEVPTGVAPISIRREFALQHAAALRSDG